VGFCCVFLGCDCFVFFVFCVEGCGVVGGGVWCGGGVFLLGLGGVSFLGGVGWCGCVLLRVWGGWGGFLEEVFFRVFFLCRCVVWGE